MRLKFLIADQDYVFAQKLDKALKGKGADSFIALSWSDIETLSGQNEFSAVLLNYDFHQTSPQDVISFIRTQNTMINIFLIFDSQEILRNADLSMKNRQRGVTDIIVKDIQMDKILDLLIDNDENSSDESDFFPLRMKFLEEKEFAEFDIYIKSEQGKYQLLLQRGRIDNRERILTNSQNCTQPLYLQSKDRFDLLRNLSKKLVSISTISKKECPKKNAELIAGIGELIIAQLVTNGFHPEEIKLAETLVNKTHSLIIEEPEVGDNLLQIVDTHNFIKNHSIMSVSITSLICQNLEWVTPKIAEESLFAALVQNIALVRYGLSSSETDESQSPEQKNESNHHPIMGYRFLQNYPISEKIRQIVLQHHESYDGSGFPFGIKGSNIFPPARIVFLASSLAEYMLIKNLSLKASLERLIRDTHTRSKFDPNVLKALVNALIKNK